MCSCDVSLAARHIVHLDSICLLRFVLPPPRMTLLLCICLYLESPKVRQSIVLLFLIII